MKSWSCLNEAHSQKTNQKPFYKHERTASDAEKPHDWPNRVLCKWHDYTSTKICSCECPERRCPFHIPTCPDLASSDLSVESWTIMKVAHNSILMPVNIKQTQHTKIIYTPYAARTFKEYPRRMVLKYNWESDILRAFSYKGKAGNMSVLNGSDA